MKQTPRLKAILARQEKIDARIDMLERQLAEARRDLREAQHAELVERLHLSKVSA